MGGGLTPVIFDLDGTLIHSAPDLHRAANDVLAEEGIAPIPLETVISFVGSGVPKLVERMIDHVGLPMARHGEIVTRYLAAYEAAPTALTLPYPGVRAALDALQRAGHPLGICTNKPEAPTRAILTALDLAGYFSVVVGGDTLPQRKPDPAPLRAAMSGFDAEKAIYVGDSEVDAATAQTAAVPFLLYSGGYRKTPVDTLPHDAVFDAFDALPALVAGQT